MLRILDAHFLCRWHFIQQFVFCWSLNIEHYLICICFNYSCTKLRKNCFLQIRSISFLGLEGLKMNKYVLCNIHYEIAKWNAKNIRLSLVSYWVTDKNDKVQSHIEYSTVKSIEIVLRGIPPSPLFDGGLHLGTISLDHTVCVHYYLEVQANSKKNCTKKPMLFLASLG